MRKTKKRKKGGGFLDKKVIIQQLDQFNPSIPRDITQRITRHLATLTIDKTRRNYYAKRAIKHFFTNLLEQDQDDIDPSDPEIAEQITRAARLLHKDDASPFWNVVLARIYFSLYDNVFAGERENLKKTERGFLKLAGKFDLDVTPNHYLGSMYVFELFDEFNDFWESHQGSI